MVGLEQAECVGRAAIFMVALFHGELRGCAAWEIS
jgi:hypothetical protein